MYANRLQVLLWKSVGGKRVLQKNPSTRAATLRFRQKCSYLRIPATADQVRAWVRDGNQVFVSMFYRESVASLAEALREEGLVVAVVDGSMSSADQETAIRQFQTGAAPVIVSTTTSAINLHTNELLLPENLTQDAWIAMRSLELLASAPATPPCPKCRAKKLRTWQRGARC